MNFWMTPHGIHNFILPYHFFVDCKKVCGTCSINPSCEIISSHLSNFELNAVDSDFHRIYCIDAFLLKAVRLESMLRGERTLPFLKGIDPSLGLKLLLKAVCLFNEYHHPYVLGNPGMLLIPRIYCH